MTWYGLLWGGHAGHGMDYIIRAGEKPMVEDYFASRVFRHLSFGDDLE